MPRGSCSWPLSCPIGECRKSLPSWALSLEISPIGLGFVWVLRSLKGVNQPQSGLGLLVGFTERKILY